MRLAMKQNGEGKIRMDNKKNMEYDVDFLKKRLEELFENEKIKGISANKIAKEIQIGRSTVSKYINGTALPSISVLVNLAYYFNVSTDYLLGLTDIPSSNLTERGIGEQTGLLPSAIKNCKRIKDEAVKVKAKRTNELQGFQSVYGLAEDQLCKTPITYGHGPLEVFDDYTMNALIANDEFKKLVGYICEYVNVSWQRQMNIKKFEIEGYNLDDLNDEDREIALCGLSNLAMFNISKTSEKIAEKISEKYLERKQEKIVELTEFVYGSPFNQNGNGKKRKKMK